MPDGLRHAAADSADSAGARDLLLHDAKPCRGGLVLDGRFWRKFVARSLRACSVGGGRRCRQRVEFVLGQVELSEKIERRWLDVPELREEDRAILEAARVAEPCEATASPRGGHRPGLLRFSGEVAGVLLQLLRPPGSSSAIVLWKIWMAMLAVRGPKPGIFLEEVDDSLQLRLFLEVMSHEQLPSERRIKGFATERLNAGHRVPGPLASVLAAPGRSHRDYSGVRHRQRRHACPGAYEKDAAAKFVHLCWMGD